MSKILTALVAIACASVAVAQSTAPSQTTGDRQSNVQSVTQQGRDNSGNAQATAVEQAKNVRASREVAKLSKDERASLAKESIKANVNPDNSSGVAATARMQPQTTAASKATGKQNTEFKSKSGQAQLYSDLRKNSTP